MSGRAQFGLRKSGRAGTSFGGGGGHCSQVEWMSIATEGKLIGVP